MLKKLFIYLVIIISLFTTGCNKNESNDYIPENEKGSIENDIHIDTSRKIYYEAFYSFYTENIDELAKKMSDKVGKIGGYTEKSSTSYNQDTKVCTRAHYVYRVPTLKLNEFIDYLESFEGITDSQLSSTDITSSYEENVARIQTLVSRLNAYNKLLEEENLSRSEIIQIESRIDEISSELTKLNNIKDKYDGLIEYSTVTINIQNTRDYKKNSWFSEYLDYLKEFVIVVFNVIMYTLPFAMIVGIILFIIFFPKYKRNRKKIKKEKEHL